MIVKNLKKTCPLKIIVTGGYKRTKQQMFKIIIK